MSLRLPNLSEVPPGGWKYWVEETKTWIHSWSDYKDFRAEVMKHLRANNLPIPLEIDDLIQEQVCKRLASGKCEHAGVQPGGEATTWERVSRGTRTIAATLLNGSWVSNEVAAARAKICRHCENNEAITGCPSCQLAKVAEMIIGFIKKRPQFGDIKACRICGCALNVKVYVEREEILKREPEELSKQYPEHCWLHSNHATD